MGKSPSQPHKNASKLPMKKVIIVSNGSTVGPMAKTLMLKYCFLPLNYKGKPYFKPRFAISANANRPDAHSNKANIYYKVSSTTFQMVSGQKTEKGASCSQTGTSLMKLRAPKSLVKPFTTRCRKKMRILFGHQRNAYWKTANPLLLKKTYPTQMEKSIKSSPPNSQSMILKGISLVWAVFCSISPTAKRLKKLSAKMKTVSDDLPRQPQRDWSFMKMARSSMQTQPLWPCLAFQILRNFSAGTC